MASISHPSRTHLRRNSPITSLDASQGIGSQPGMIKSINVGSDSDSDDEPPPAIRFSKVTQALLADAEPVSPVRQQEAHDGLRLERSNSARSSNVETPSREPGIRIVRRGSPPRENGLEGSRRTTPPRIVQMNATRTGSAAKRAVSVNLPSGYASAYKRDPTPETSAKLEMKTPAPRVLRVARPRAGSNASQDEPLNGIASTSRPGSRTGFRNAPDTNERKAYPTDLARSASLHYPPETLSRYGLSTIGRSRVAPVETGSHAPQGMKRVPDGENKFLRSKPVRRGGHRRRDSEDNVSPIDDPQSGQSSQPSAGAMTPQEQSRYRVEGSQERSISAAGRTHGRASSLEPGSSQDLASHRDTQAHTSRPPSRQGSQYVPRIHSNIDHRPPTRQASQEVGHVRQGSVEPKAHQPNSGINQLDSGVILGSTSQARYRSVEPDQARPVAEQKPSSYPSSLNQAGYRNAQSRSHIDSADDQENLPPPTFKRNKDQEFRYLGKPSLMAFSDDDKPRPRIVDETPVPVPEQRRPLGNVSGNTPHRPAPAPPPKMSVLDAATTTAGASTTKSRKKRQHMVVNGKIYTQMGKLGKGGSSEVYCVMAENYKTFALKRVKLTDCDESAVRGYKGEIDLLKKLTEVERVVRLFDWEINEEKQELLVLMDKGELDLSRILTLQLNSGEGSFDISFTRFYWKEMLECVQAVHDHDIVHSDLKPANFLMVQGRLKLIDFGIANAIDTDNTCNVHRDSHVGTPNYMSPESINDTNASSGGRDEAGRPLKKDMRIGKSSDVWSLGCILYQMAYGIPPFAHIKSQVSKIMAIVNPKHNIEYPETGVGGAYIPLSLRNTLRRCLNRDPERRLTIKQMLDGTDSFLNPEGTGAGSVLMSEELLGQIINKIIDRCKDPKRGIPTPEEAQAYPRSFMEKIRQMQEGR
ncbi:kinase-like protein [Dissoconium aciculare CBS 342.82]|uniref:Kinase-like protein n=1 Tax=Dissoconium aciculare CBS 342.82 TaxID=1314786 RepID=A0A6J3M0Y8_9PEZI|nr:kinase-like protein [Dissoconium aciculare CBS 342.82]KAF1821169.1 kinase-like protein [Dissoconium aciculare CBS 342.82]